MDKADKFLLKISSRNKKWQKLRQKERELAIYREYPVLVDKCIELKKDIDFIKNELKIWFTFFFVYDDVGLKKNHLKSSREYEIMDVKNFFKKIH